MSRFPTADLQQRLLGNGGALPSGLFRPNYYRRKRPRGARPPYDPNLPYQMEELGRLLRNLTNINVRQPSHMAPPFRATQFLFQTFLPGTVDAGTIPVNGNDSVPSGSLGILTHVLFTAGGSFQGSPTFPHWGEDAGTGSTLSLMRNGVAIPSFSAVRPSMTVGIQQGIGADFWNSLCVLPPAPMVPVPLLQGDVLSFETNLVGGSGYLQVSGYTFPIELDGDGVRGTLADRG
jgi:hypothetical protein